MEILPFHLLELVGHFVNCFGFDHGDLLAFAQVSRVWRAASERHLFENIQIQLKSYDVTTGFEDIEKALSGTRRAWVRRLEITGGNEGTEWFTTLKAQRELSQHDWIEGSHDSCEWYSKTDVNHRYLGSRETESWDYIAHFIQSLSGLRDIIWHHPQQVPSCILKVIHTKLPRTRLHIHTFHLRTLYNGPPSASADHEQIGQDEWDLITSPNLHCIACHYTDSKQELALINMAGGLSPNLKIIQHTGHTETYRQSRWLPQPVFSWPDYLPSKEATEPERRGITSLRLALNASADSSNFSVYTPGPSNTLRAWELIDLSKIRNLEIVCNNSSGVLQKLTVMAREGAFQDLNSFSYGPFTGRNKPELDLALSIFLEDIRPLSRLCLSGPICSTDRTFTTILHKHGASLRNLRLDRGRHKPGMSGAEWIRKIGLLAEFCPRLEILNLGIARSQGDQSEVAIYRTLSWIQRLKYLRLSLDISEFHPRRLEALKDGGGVDDDEVSLVRRPYVDFATSRACLINSAIDSNLALSIFDIVAGQGSNLESLSLSVCGDWLWTERAQSNISGEVSIITFATSRTGPMFQQDQHMKELLKYVGNPWVVRRDRLGGIKAKQDKFVNDERALEFSRGAARLRDNFSGREDLKKIWRSV